MKIIKINRKDSIPNNFTGIVEYPDGKKSWYKEGNLHRLDGPAIEYPSTRKEWYKEGKIHRLDGPAIEFPNGEKQWWIECKLYLPEKLLCLINSSFYFGKEKGQYNLEWLRFLTKEKIEKFPIIPGIEEYKDFKKIFDKLKSIETK